MTPLIVALALIAAPPSAGAQKHAARPHEAPAATQAGREAARAAGRAAARR